MSSYFMVQYSYYSSFSVLYRQTYVYFGFATLWIMGYTGWSYFIPTKLQNYLVLNL
jgi:hypothetical protein